MRSGPGKQASKSVAFRVGWIHVHVSGVCVGILKPKPKPLLHHRHRHSIITDTHEQKDKNDDTELVIIFLVDDVM